MTATRLDGHKTATGRTGAGQFATGNPGGPGRPRRAVESEYLAIVGDSCPASVWREIVESAVADARTGDATARAWLSSHLIGKPHGIAPTLHSVALDEVNDIDPLATDATLQRLLAGG
jgi:hypothetical protein